ncbi:MAG: WecB/TagA/CpsF family glycosyltransferase [Lachnospiraceae bacterium]|nr:WecB/TagA/CpsF family glycosyltransferase [Lachnospiraceae bacterium]
MDADKLHQSKSIHLLGINFSALDMASMLDEAMERVSNRKAASLVFLNVDVVIKSEQDRFLRTIIDTAEYVLADGMPLIWLSRLFGRPLPEKVSGADFVPRLCQRAEEEGRSIFFAGGSERSLKNACARLREQYPGLRVDGCSPPMGFENDPAQIEALCQTIHQAAPDILVICLGCPKQEKFMYEYRKRYAVPVSVCAGATVDFLSGAVKRCPAWMSQSGLEWFYRFLQEPRRLFRRYFIEDMQILRLILKYWRETS